MEQFVDDYNSEVDRYRRTRQKQKDEIDIDTFVRADLLRWTHNLKQALARERYATVEPSNFRRSLYRPFCRKWLFFDRLLNERIYLTPRLFPTPAAEAENVVICCTSHMQMPFACMVTNCLPNEAVGGRNGQCFGFYTYSDDGSSRSENITDWALSRFRKHYGDSKISKWDIFHYVSAALHHPEFRVTFAENLQRELPRVPLMADFWAFVKAGKRLSELHLGYESVEPWELEWVTAEGKPLAYYVERMKLNNDKTTLKVNDSLSLTNIPPETFDYHIGNRSALEWIIDQYKVSEDKGTGIKSDPNLVDDEKYIVRLVGQVVRVSVETVRIVSELPAMP